MTAPVSAERAAELLRDAIGVVRGLTEPGVPSPPSLLVVASRNLCSASDDGVVAINRQAVTLDNQSAEIARLRLSVDEKIAYAAGVEQDRDQLRAQLDCELGHNPPSDGWRWRRGAWRHASNAYVERFHDGHTDRWQLIPVGGRGCSLHDTALDGMLFLDEHYAKGADDVT